LRAKPSHGFTGQDSTTTFSVPCRYCASDQGIAMPDLKQISLKGAFGAIGVVAPRIWIVNRYFWPDHSATSQMASDLAFHLARRGYAVSVITSRGLYEDANADLSAFESQGGVTVHRVGRTHFGRKALGGRALDDVSLCAAFAFALARLAKSGDIVIAKTDPPLLSCAVAAVATPRKLRQVNWLQDLYPEVALGLGVDVLRPVAPLLCAIRDLSLRGGAQNVAIGRLMAGRLQALGLPHSAVTTIPNWNDDDAIRPVDRSNNPLRRSWGLEASFVVGHSGNLGRAHEVETLLGALDHFEDDGSIVFLFVGGGKQFDSLRAEADRRSLKRLMQFRPYQPSALLPHSLGLPDVHWLSLRPEMEGLIVPSKFYGIASAGRGVVAVVQSSGEIGRLVDEAGCGIVVKPGDSRSFAAAVKTLAQEPAQVDAMGLNARLLIDRQFGRARSLAAWERLLGDLL
jgi:colanic acid biosynthesis glycosyl transferase WcaI